jgi:DNA-binding CsgD family transcriptional regulator
MPEIDDFSNIIGVIYDTALDPNNWPSALEQICRFVPGSHANIFIQDAAVRSANAIFTWGDDPYWHQMYLEKYAKINPLFPGLFFHDVEEVFTASDVVPAAQIEKTPFYREWQHPQGICDGMISILEKSETSCAIIALPRHERLGPVTESDRERMRRIVPHVRRAILISKAVELQVARAEMFSDTIDRLASAVYLLGPDCAVRHANRSGLSLIDRREILDLSHGQLRLDDPAADRELRAAVSAAATGDDLALGVEGIAIPLATRDGERYGAHVLPLTSGARRHDSVSLCAAALFVQKAALNLATVPELMAKLYGLTPSEIAVVLAIVEIGGAPAVADLMGLSRETVKSHLRSIFAKTSVRRQADLTKLVAQFAASTVTSR